MSEDLEKLQQLIGYTFRDEALLRRALTHASFANEHGRGTMRDNERLEFLGDSVLGLVIADLIFRRLDTEEGELARAKNNLVNSHTLQQKANGIELGRFLLLGRGEEQSGGRQRRGNLENGFEALIGAIFLDGGFEAAKTFVKSRFAADLDAWSLEQTSRIEYKGKLQEIVQARNSETPVYRIVREDGPAHQKHFTAEVFISGEPVARGQGATKKEAEQQAARKALERL